MKKILLFVAFWRALLTIVNLVSVKLFEYKPSFFAADVLSPMGSRWLTSWAHFDGILYLQIAQHGYGSWGAIQAFFPLYPILIRIISLNGFINPLVVGVVISLTALVVALYFLIKLVKLDFDDRTAYKTVILLLALPTSFYFTAVYTESLFLLWIVLFFYHVRTHKFAKAALWAFLAALTRLVGVALVFAFVYEYWLYYKKVKPNVVLIVSPLVALGSYMTYLGQRFRDPLYFYTVQKGFGANRETSKLILLYQVFYRYIKMFMSVPIGDRLFYIISQEFIAGVLGLVGLIIGWLTLRRSYIIFAACAYILPTLTGTFSSLPRYLLPLFPFCILLAKYLPTWAYVVMVICSLVLLSINVSLFTQGLWVS